jgi:hypothetical protein
VKNLLLFFSILGLMSLSFAKTTIFCDHSEESYSIEKDAESHCHSQSEKKQEHQASSNKQCNDCSHCLTICHLSLDNCISQFKMPMPTEFARIHFFEKRQQLKQFHALNLRPPIA